MSTIDVVLITWPNHPRRMEFLRRTWDSLQANLCASDHLFRFLCSSESEPDPECKWCGEELEEFCRENFIPLSWAKGPASLGHGMNAAMDLSDSDVVFIHQDDYELLHPLDLSPGANMLVQHREVDLIRYGYPPQEFGWRLLPYQDGWMRFDTTAKWSYGDEPHLQRRDFANRYRYTEGNGHASEGCMLHNLVAHRAIILAADKPYYGHFGCVSSVPRVQETAPCRTCRR